MSIMDALQENLNDFSKMYDKDAAIVETAYAYTQEDRDGLESSFRAADEVTAGYTASVEGQKEFMKDPESIDVLNVPAQEPVSSGGFESDNAATYASAGGASGRRIKTRTQS